MVSDQLAAYIHGYIVNLTGERERRLVLRRYRRAHIRAAVDGAEQSDAERIGQRDVALSDLLAIDVEVALARRAFAVRDVGFVCYLEFKPQLMTPCGHRCGGFDVVQIPAYVVVRMTKLPVLNVERVAAVVAALGEQHTLRAALGNLHVCRNAIRAVEYISSGVDRHALSARVKYVRR